MAFSNPGLTPAIRALNQAALNAAYKRAQQTFPALPLEGSIEEAFIRAIQEASANGERDLEELTKAALSVVPKARPPRGLKR